MKYILNFLFVIYVFIVVGIDIGIISSFDYSDPLEWYSLLMMIAEGGLIYLVFLYLLKDVTYKSKLLLVVFCFVLLSYLYGIAAMFEFYIAAYGYVMLIFQIPAFYLFYKVSVTPNLKEGS